MSGGCLTWAEIDQVTKNRESSVYDWCWICGAPLGPDKMHVLIDNGRVVRHTYCCRKHRYVVVLLADKVTTQVQTRTDHEIEALSWAFKDGTLKPGWE